MTDETNNTEAAPEVKPTKKSKRKLVIAEPAEGTVTVEGLPTEAAEEAKPVKPPKPTVEWLVTPNGEKLKPGTVIHTTWQLFNRPAEEALKFEQIVDELCAKFPDIDRGRHMFTVRRRTASFLKNYGQKVGVAEDGRISFNIEERHILGRRLSTEEIAARDAALAEKAKLKEEAKAKRDAEKTARNEAKEKAKLEREEQKAAQKAAKEKAKAEAAEAAKAAGVTPGQE